MPTAVDVLSCFTESPESVRVLGLRPARDVAHAAASCLLTRELPRRLDGDAVVIVRAAVILDAPPSHGSAPPDDWSIDCFVRFAFIATPRAVDVFAWLTLPPEPGLSTRVPTFVLLG